MSREHKRLGWRLGAAALLFVLGVGTGLGLAAWGGEVQAKGRAENGVYQRLSVFAKVLNYVETNYVDAVDSETLIYGAVKGLLDTLDPHSSFLPPDVFKELKIDTTGEYQGLGLMIDYDETSPDGGFIIQDVIPGGPADKVKLRRGDGLIKVDGVDLAGMSMQEATRLLRGPIGSVVHLTVQSTADSTLREIPLVRAVVHMTAVASATYKPLGYIRIKAFQNQTAREVRRTVNRWLSQNPPAVKGIVLDLRNNPGGLLDEAVGVADIFLDKGVIVSVEGRNTLVAERSMARKENTWASIPLALLMNGGSASAAEVVAGALQDSSRALIVGSRSYGKGSVQNIIDLEDGSGLKLTVARYFTPKHRSIHGVGIEPDMPVADPRELLMPVEDARQVLAPSMKALIAPRPETGIAADDWPLLVAYAKLVGDTQRK